jgi:hypothetical protein
VTSVSTTILTPYMALTSRKSPTDVTMTIARTLPPCVMPHCCHPPSRQTIPRFGPLLYPDAKGKMVTSGNKTMANEYLVRYYNAILEMPNVKMVL